MASDLCDECRQISIASLRSYSGFEHSTLLRNLHIGIPSECALCSAIDKVLPEYLAKDWTETIDRWKKRRVRFYVHPDQIGDLFVTVGCPPHENIWIGGRTLVSRSEDGVVRALRIFADRGM